MKLGSFSRKNRRAADADLEAARGIPENYDEENPVTIKQDDDEIEGGTDCLEVWFAGCHSGMPFVSLDLTVGPQSADVCTQMLVEVRSRTRMNTVLPILHSVGWSDKSFYPNAASISMVPLSLVLIFPIPSSQELGSACPQRLPTIDHTQQILPRGDRTHLKSQGAIRLMVDFRRSLPVLPPLLCQNMIHSPLLISKTRLLKKLRFILLPKAT